MLQRLKNALMQMGFSDTEAQIYILLVRLGRAGAGTIIKEMNLPRATVYQLLDKLADRGLVIKIDRGNVLMFAAEEPEQLLSILKKREDDIQKQKQTIHTILPELLLLKNPTISAPKVSYVEGADGYIELLGLVLESESKTISMITSSEYVRENLLDEVKLENILRYENGEFIKKRVNLGVHMRLLTQSSELGRKMKERDRLELRETRFLPDDFGNIETMILFDSSAIIITDNHPIVGIHIEDMQTATMLKSIFEFIWKSL